MHPKNSGPDRIHLLARLSGPAGVIILCAALTGLFLSSCASPTQTAFLPPQIEGAALVGNAACADCHAEITAIFPASPHGLFHKDDLQWAGRTGCESCHGPGSKHIESGGARQFIVNPGRDPSACFQCHQHTLAEFHMPHHHPVMDGKMNCIQCHDPHGPDLFKPAGGLAMARLNESCASCHREQSRPFLFEHAALREGCVTCHQPHGSINPKLLTVRDNNLCLQCHAQIQGPDVPGNEIFIGGVPHAAFLSRGTCWSSGCHTSVHGSNIHPQLLY